MKPKLLFLIIILLLVFTLSGCIVINAPGNPAPIPESTTETDAKPDDTSAAPDASIIPAPPTPTPAPVPTPLAPLTVTDTPATYANAYISVNIHCPEISGMQDGAMQNGINSGVSGFLTGSANALEQLSVQEEADYGAHPPYSYETSFTVMRNDGHLLSIMMEIQSYEGGAHPAYTFATINAVNSNPGEQWSLADLFVSGADYVAEINSEISAMIAADASMSGAFWFSSINANQAYYLTDTHLVILFEPYSIAPGAYGAPKFEIPFGHLPSLNSF